MKILFVAHRLNLSGASVHNLELGKGLVRLGHEVGIVVRDTAAGEALGKEKFEKSGFWVKQVDLPDFSKFTALYSLKQCRASFLAAVKEFGPDVIHVQAPTLSPFCSGCLSGKIPVLSTFNIEQIGLLKRIVARLLLLINKRSFGEKIFAISEEMKESLVEKIGIDPMRLIKIPYSIDAERFHPPSEEEVLEARETFGLPKDASVVSVPAILDRRKGQEYALRALSMLRMQGVDVFLVCAGADYGDGGRLQKLSEKLGITEYVRFPGHINPLALYWASDIVLLPSLKEGFGLVVLEGMCCGCIPIRTPTAGCSDQVVDGETGFIIRLHSADDIFKKVNEVLSNESESHRIRANAIGHAKRNFSVEVMADITVKAYLSEVVGGKGEG